MNGLLTPAAGTVEVDGYLTSDSRQLGLVRKRIGLLFPSPDSQLIASTVEEDIAFGPENMGLAPIEIKNRVDTALSMVSMEDYRLYPPNLLSGGQKQLVCIAGLLAMHPRYLILDEPVSMLDPSSRAQILDLIVKLHQNEKIGIVLVTHCMEEAILADRIVVLNKGQIFAEGSPAAIISQSERLEKIGIEPLETSIIVRTLNQTGAVNLAPSLHEAEELVNEIWRLTQKR
jgi:energy-coupling factor transport system ATP-binding protein